MPKKYRVALTPEQRAELQRMVTVGKTAVRTVLHARILLLVDAGEGAPGNTDEAVVAALGTSLSTVSRVRQRFAERGLAATQRRKRKPAPPLKMDGVQEARLLALACGSPPEGQARWTLRLLADRFVELETGVPISHETVRKVLKRGRCSLGG
jgi:transposase